MQTKTKVEIGVLAVLVIAALVVGNSGFLKGSLQSARPVAERAQRCANPYKAGANCAKWSCAVGTTPDNASSQCVCKPGFTETSTDRFGRRVCTQAPQSALAITALVVNPASFNPTNNETTQISFATNQTANLVVEIKKRSDGSLVRAMANSLNAPRDTYYFSWDGKDTAGNTVTAGNYFVLITATGGNQSIQRTADITVVAPPPPAISAGTLTVSRSSTPVSQTVVKGTRNVNLLGLLLSAGTSSDVIVSRLSARLVADDDGTFDNSGYGDTAANTIIYIASLYKVNADGTETQIAATGGLSLVGTIGAAGGYYKADFSGFNYNLAKSTTEKWLIKADITSTLTATRYVAADLILSNAAHDIEAYDATSGDRVLALQPQGASETGPNNLGTGNPTTLITVVPVGRLAASQEGSPDSQIVVGGNTGVSMSKYKFSAINEPFTITQLDVVVDNDGSFSDDPATDNNAVGRDLARVGLLYNRGDGTMGTIYGMVSQGKATFAGNLNIPVPKDGVAFVTIFADINQIQFGAISGDRFRLGLNEQGAAANAFEAVGAGSTQKLTAHDVPVTNSSGVHFMVVRKTVPTVAKLAGLPTRLVNGINDIAAVTIAADAKEAVALKRIAFEFASSSMDVNSLHLVRKIGSGSGSDITSQVSIKNKIGQDLKAGGVNLAWEGGTWRDVIYLTWDNAATDQEFISRGVTNTYILRATVANAGVNESLSTYIADDLTFVPGSTAAALLPTGYYFIWSDNSALSHSTTTSDWTNGADVPSLPTSTLSLSF